MDSAEKFCYLIGAMDMWEVFSKKLGKTQVQEKKALIIEEVIPFIASRMKDDEINQMMIEIREANVIKIIDDIMKSKMNAAEVYKELKRKDQLKIDWEKLKKDRMF